MPAVTHTPPAYAGIIVGFDDRSLPVIWPIRLPAVPGVCACVMTTGSMNARGVVICVECGKVMSERARASG